MPRLAYALMDPHPGLVLEIIDADARDTRPDLERWLLADYLPGRVNGKNSVDTAVLWRTNAPDAGMKPEVRAAAEKTANAGKRLTLLWFLAEDPRDIWKTFMIGEDSRISSGSNGAVALVAPFVPSHMGTDQYDDQLR